MDHAVAKQERRVDALKAKIESALADPTNWPTDWEQLLDRAGEAVDRAVDLTRKARNRIH